MTDKKDSISYEEYQKLSEEEKQNYETSWNSDSKSDTATRKGAKLPEVKSTTPVAEEKQADPSTSRTTVTVKDAAADAEATRKVEDKANRMRDSLKAKTDTTATGKSINQFQIGKKSDFDEQNKVTFEGLKQQEKQLAEIRKGKEAALAAVKKAEAEEEAANAVVKKAQDEYNQVKQLRDELQSFVDRLKGDSPLGETVNIAKAAFDTKRMQSVRAALDKLAKDYGIDVGNSKFITGPSLTKDIETINNTLEARMQEALTNQRKTQEVAESARNQLTEVTTKEQEAQAKYDKDQKDYKTWEAKYWVGAEKDETKTEKDETKTEKDETKTEKETEKEDPLKKAEELEQPRAPADIKKFSNDLNRFVIQAYLNGDFGKKSSPNAIASMGFFILDKLGTALVNASEVARGMSPSAKSQWGNILDIQTNLLGKRLTSEWFLSQPREKQEALIRSGVLSGVPSASTIYNTVDPNAVARAEQRDILGISKLSQEQKGVAQSNVNALLARKSELQTLITQLKSDQGWEVYTQAMNAVVGTAKGLSSLGVTDDSSSSSNKGFSDQLSASVSTGNIVSKFVSGKVSNSSNWNNSSAESLSKSNSLNQDALALSKFKSGEDYAKATREAKKAANEQLIKRLEGQIEIIDKCIDSWGKDLGL